MKRLGYIFVSIFTFFLMSHIIFTKNVSAVTTTLDLSGYSIVNTSSLPKVNCVYSNSSLNKSNVSYCSESAANGYISLNSIVTTDKWILKSNDLVEFNVIVFSSVSFADLNGFTVAALPNLGGFRLLEFNQIASNVFTNDIQSVTNGTGGTSFNGNGFYSIYHVVMKYLAGDNLSFNLGVAGIGLFNYDGDTVSFALGNIIQYRLSGEGSIDQQNEINATQDAADNSSNTGSSSSSDATAATSSLISVIGGFVSVVTSATPTNCQINAYTDHLDMGNIDLCANPVPSYIQIIGSIILICAVIPLAIILFNRFIGLFRSFQG